MKINPYIEIPDEEIEESYIRASGPGGQNVNKVSSAVQLRFNLAASNALPPEIKKRIQMLAKNRINAKGELLIEANSYRTQSRNRQVAREKLSEIIRIGLKRPRKRIQSKPSRRSNQSRINSKKKRAKIKSNRRKVLPGSDD